MAYKKFLLNVLLTRMLDYTSMIHNLQKKDHSYLSEDLYKIQIHKVPSNSINPCSGMKTSDQYLTIHWVRLLNLNMSRNFKVKQNNWFLLYKKVNSYAAK